MKRILLFAAMLFVTLTSMAQDPGQVPQLPNDAAFRTGKLSNGLTYYIRHNDYPKNTANFYILDRVGSVQENDQQQGLAHFLEHMAFNGSEHFPNNNMMDVIKQLGISRFNAETGFDFTRYYLCDVSTARQTTLDSCLLILRDWANGLQLNADEIQKERGVIHQEWQSSQTPDGRFQDKCFALMLPGSKYGQRLPIGKMEIVDNVNPKQLRDYYHTWYRPDNQAIVVIGNVDADYIEGQIKKLFGDINVAPNAPKVEDYPVPDNANAICIFFTDKDQDTPSIQFYLKHDELPAEMKGTVAKPISDYASATMLTMLNQRLSEISRDPNAPFSEAGFMDNHLLGIVKTKQSLMGGAVPKAGKTMEALQRIAEELMRIQKFGFTATEYGRARSEYLSQLEKRYNNRNSTPNDAFFTQAFNNFNYADPMPSVDTEYQMMKMVAPQMPVDGVNEYARSIIANCDSNLIAVVMTKDEGQDIAKGEAQMRQALANARQAKLTAYVDNVKQEPLMTTLPKKGAIKSTKENSKLGYKEYTLSNGAKVIVKKTDFKADEIVMQAETEGGASLYGKDDYVNCDLLDDISQTYTYNGHNSVDLSKMLAGKQASVSHKISADEYTISGSTTPKDLETMMQLVYLSFTSTGKDQQAFDQQMTVKMQEAKDSKMNPELAFMDSISAIINQHNLYYMDLDSARLSKASYDRILAITHDATANAANWTFYISGNVDEKTLLPMMEQYIASLPGKPGKKTTARDLRTVMKGDVMNITSRRMVTPRAFAAQAWISNDQTESLDNMIYPSVVVSLMQTNTMKSIREDAGIAYTPQNYTDTPSFLDHGNTALISFSEVKPGTTAQAADLMQKALQDIANGAKQEEVDKVKRTLLSQIDVLLNMNQFWITVLSEYNKYGIDLSAGFRATVNAITPQSISKYVNDNFLQSGRHCQVIINPEK